MADTSSEHRREWNVYTLKEHFDGLASARDKAVEAALIAQKGEVAAALAAAKEAVLKAEISTDKRFQAANGFREAMLDQQKTFVTKGDFENARETMSDLKMAISKIENKDLGATTSTDRLMQMLPILISLVAVAAVLFKGH
jgi:hypothetical protein